MNSNSQNASDISKLESEISRNLDCWKDISCLMTNVQSSLKYLENWNYIKCHSDSFIGISSHNLRVGWHIFRCFSLVSSAVYNSWEEYKDLHQKQGERGEAELEERADGINTLNMSARNFLQKLSNQVCHHILQQSLVLSIWAPHMSNA